MSNIIELSPLNHTWIFDIDGTLVKHNGYKLDGMDTLLPGVKEFFDNNIKDDDYVLLVTSRKLEYKNITESFLKKEKIRFDKIIYELPYGERILVNDSKPSGLKMSLAINSKRDEFLNNKFIINDKL